MEIMQNKKMKADRTNSILLVTSSKKILLLLLWYFTDNQRKQRKALHENRCKTARLYNDCTCIPAPVPVSCMCTEPGWRQTGPGRCWVLEVGL